MRSASAITAPASSAVKGMQDWSRNGGSRGSRDVRYPLSYRVPVAPAREVTRPPPTSVTVGNHDTRQPPRLAITAGNQKPGPVPAPATETGQTTNPSHLSSIALNSENTLTAALARWVQVRIRRLAAKQGGSVAEHLAVPRADVPSRR